MKTKKTDISIFTTTWGHKSIGVAVKDVLGSKFPMYFNYIEPNPISVKPYNLLYILFPSFTKIPFKISESNYISKIVEKYLSKPYSKTVEEMIKKQKPKIVISTYFAFSFVLAKLCYKYHFKLINILADPRSFHKLSVLPGVFNFVFDNDAKKRCQRFGINKKNIIVSGWFVRKEFQNAYNKRRVRKLLGLDNDVFTICVVGGSVGTAAVLKILPAFVDIKNNVQVIFICGKNKNIYRSLKIFKGVHDLQNGNFVKYIIKGYTENTHEYLQASDLVIGKAGPNLLFETVATKTPFFAVSHIAGQEDGNLEIIKRYKIGFVEENPVKAIKLTRKIIRNPKILYRFQKPLQKLADHNNNSFLILQRFIEAELNEGKK